MKHIKFLLLALPLIAISCSKSDGGTPTPTPTPTSTESAIAFSITQDPGAGVLGVVGTSQALNIKVTSTLPSAGVNIDVSVKKDLDNSTVFSNSSSSVAADVTTTITGLTPGVQCTATVVVTSKSTSSNNKTVSFKLAAK